MHQSIKAVLVLPLAIMAISCARLPADNGTEIVSYGTLLSRNLSNLNKLSVGMTKSQVMEIMGTFSARTRDSMVPNPYRIEPFSVGNTQYEVLYYLTKRYPPFTPIKESQTTPVVLKNGRVIGSSRGMLHRAKAGEFEKR